MKEYSMKEIWEIWDAGELFYGNVETELMNRAEGEKVGDIFENVTKCPVHNGTCDSLIRVLVCGMNPDKGGQWKEAQIDLCPLGCTNIDECILSK